MKAINYGVIGIALFLLLSTNAIAQKKKKMKPIEIQKTIKINADIQTVYNNVAFLENFPKWSPFLEADPAQEYEIKGPDGQVGAQFHWNGNKGKDLGYQEIKSISPNENVLIQCDIQKPFKAQPTFSYSFTQEGGQVLVTQVFKLPVKSMDKLFMKLFGAVKGIHKMNARGLELLKITSEK